MNGCVLAQNAVVTGTVLSDDRGIEKATVGIRENPSVSAITSERGTYTLSVEPGKVQTLMFYSISHDAMTQTIVAQPGETVKLVTSLQAKQSTQFKEVVVTDFKTRSEEALRLSPVMYPMLPTVTGNIEDLIKTQIGVSSNNELSSGYSVRGGNYDENLVYVNDIEVYRPFLVRSGQQEGLSFANPAMVQNMNFSAGGFEARYGDKMSSVLDITYRRPTKFGGSASASLLGGNAQVEGVTANRLLSWNIGARYRTNIYLLKTLDTKGEYRPSSMDVQSFLTFRVSPRTTVEFLGNIANNSYLVIPSNRQTDFGTVNDALRFTVYFDGRELMAYTTYMAGLSTTFRPDNKTRLKLITSAYRANEQEVYTVQGQYYIDQLEADLSKPTFGQVAYNRGVGTFINNGRNYLTAQVFNMEHKGVRQVNNDNELLWGVRHQFERIDDQLGEWRTVDSAGYIVPYSPTDIQLSDVYKTKIVLPSMRSQGYVQHNFTHRLADSSNLKITTGIRGNYWTVNEQFLFSPRMTVAYKPFWKRDWLFKFSTGIYYQPPFYRELRNFDGTINKDVKAQRSIHFVLSSDYIFNMWSRPFKLIIASYYKDLSSIIPYEIDNVRIRYYANNATKGYATGMDVRINGQFVDGVESWATIGVLRTYEYSKNNIHYDYFNKEGQPIVKGYTFDQVKADSVKIDPGFIPRPTDQLVTFGLFFQDYLPRYPAFKFNLNLQFGSGLPFGPPTHKRYQQVLRMPPYRRVDAGFAYNILKENRAVQKDNFFRHIKGMWIFLEVYNLLQVQNTVSYTWVTDVTGNRYAIPNYLTNRQLNARIQVKF